MNETKQTLAARYLAVGDKIQSFKGMVSIVSVGLGPFGQGIVVTTSAGKTINFKAGTTVGVWR